MDILRSHAAEKSLGALNSVSPVDPVFSWVGKLPISYGMVGCYLAVAEFCLIIGLSMVSSAMYHIIAFENVGNLKNFSAVGVGSAILFVLALQSQHNYRPSAILHPSSILRTILTTWAGVLCAILVFAFLAKLSFEFSRGATVCFFATGSVVLPLFRFFAKKALALSIANNYLAGRRSVVLFGDLRQLSARGVADNLNRHGYKVSGQFGVAIDDANSLASCREIALGFQRLKHFVQQTRVDEIFLVFATSDQRAIDVASGRLRELPIPVRLLFDQGLGRFLSKSMMDLGAAKAVKLQSGPLTALQQSFKRMFDIVSSTIGLFALSPLLVAIAVAIRLDSQGPVIFRQRRAGFSGRTFSIYKFRTMTTLDDGDVIKQATRNDQRVTRVGRYLRKSSLDELPQLLNVLQGNMSLVGPRPHALSHDNQYNELIATYALRHHMKPGITGWAQVNGCRGETSDLASMATRVEYDLWYICHWSLLLDLKAIALTILQVFRPKNVY